MSYLGSTGRIWNRQSPARPGVSSTHSARAGRCAPRETRSPAYNPFPVAKSGKGLVGRENSRD